MAEIGVLGAGAWGTALANQAARSADKVTLWARDNLHVREMCETRENRRRLPGVALAGNVTPSADLLALAQAQLVLLAVPAQAFRGLLEGLALVLRPGVPIVICAKGIERGTGFFLSDIVADILPQHPVAVLSGPSFAQDLAKSLPTAVTLATHDAATLDHVLDALAAPYFRMYHSTDIRGAEIGGAAKNVIAIACGIAAGRQLGASAQAALVARGFAELARFGRAFGARAETLMGLSGLGDLVLTCNSPQSRNFACGFALGSGQPRANAGVVEGVHTASALVAMARARGVDMPIASAVDAILTGTIDIDGSIDALLARPSRSEGF